MSGGFYDPLAGAGNPQEAAGAGGAQGSSVPALQRAIDADYPPDSRRKEKAPRKPLIEFLRPSEIAEYVTPENHFLVGDSLIQRGSMTIFAGPGGVGKSRAVFSLAVAAARGESEWMGFPIHFGFKTMIVQSENGLPRLSKDFQKLGNAAGLDDRLLVSAPPDGMIAMKNPMFRDDLTAAALAFAPDMIVFDPLNSMVSDSQERDIIELLSYLRQIAGEVGTNPALMVVHHLRKPREGDKHRGRSMANLLAGSYVITSSARAVLTLQAASDTEDDPHTVLTVAKCNDGVMAPRSAWRRTDGGFFTHADDFDWTAFDGQSGPLAKIREEHILKVFEYGQRKMTQAVVVKELMELTGANKGSVSAAIKITDGKTPRGRFAHLIEPELVDGVLCLSAEGLKLCESDDD